MNLKLTAPIKTWDEALPIGNGLLGGLLWGEGETLRLSLDRGDLWDERPAPGNALSRFTYAQMVKLVGEKNNKEISRIVDDETYYTPTPTKIPAGRIELDLAPGQTVTAFELDLASATAQASLMQGGKAEAFFSAKEPIALVRIPGAPLKGIRLLAPESVKKINFPAAVQGSAEGLQWFVQETAEKHRYCVCVATQRTGGETLLAVTVTYAHDDKIDVAAQAKTSVLAALKTGYAALHAPHVAWWKDFWAKSSVSVPDAGVMKHYYLVQYFYGAASRTGAPPIPLQGVWTADAGELPPWKGDYHHDLNTQMTYMGYQASGRFEEGKVFLDFMHDLLPSFRKFSRDFYAAPGASVPAVMSLAGQPMGGWGQYSLSPTNGAWVGQLYYLHWRYTRDEKFLRDVAYPWCKEVGDTLAALLKPDARGVLVLPLSSSPEAFNNDIRSWLKPNSNYDIACMRMLFLGNEEMASSLGDPAAAQAWKRLADGLGAWHVTPQQILKLNSVEELTFSHRHFATLMGVYPFNLINIEGSDADRAIIKATLPDIDRLGVVEWCGYSYTWMAAMRARVNEPESALWHLKAYLHAFILRNGFHANGDQTKSGFSMFDYRPFTLEGNFLACAAVHEMLLQSWAAHPGTGEWGPVRIFPAMPWRWHEAAFTDLVAEGGHTVSARRENNATVWFKVTAARDGELRIRDNFGGRAPQWSGGLRAKKAGRDFVLTVKAGDVIEARLAKPAAIPDAPADAFLDDVPAAPKDIGVKMTY